MRKLGSEVRIVLCQDYLSDRRALGVDPYPLRLPIFTPGLFALAESLCLTFCPSVYCFSLPFVRNISLLIKDQFSFDISITVLKDPDLPPLQRLALALNLLFVESKLRSASIPHFVNAFSNFCLPHFFKQMLGLASLCLLSTLSGCLSLIARVQRVQPRSRGELFMHKSI